MIAALSLYDSLVLFGVGADCFEDILITLHLNKEKDAFQSTGFLCYLRSLLLSLSVVFCFQAPLLIKLLMLHKMLILLTHI